MNNKPAIIISLVIICNLFSCNSDKKNFNAERNQKLHGARSSITTKKLLSIEGDSILVSLDSMIVKIPKDSTIIENKPYMGIFFIKGDSIRRVFSVKNGDLLFFTTYVDLGTGYRGFLFTYNMQKKRIIECLFLNHNHSEHFLFSGAGIFFIDSNTVYCINTPEWYERKKIFVTGADIYRFTSGKFKYNRTVYEVGERALEDSSIVQFYKAIVKKEYKLIALPSKWRHEIYR